MYEYVDHQLYVEVFNYANSVPTNCLPGCYSTWRVTLELCAATNVKSTLLSDFNKNWNASLYFLYNSYRVYSYNP